MSTMLRLSATRYSRPLTSGPAPSPSTEETRLIRLSQAGDGDAFACIYDLYVDQIFRYVYLRAADRPLAEDITSQIFIKAWQKLPSYQVGSSSIRAWLYRIAHNAVVDYYRTRKTTISLEDLGLVELGQPDDTQENLEEQLKLEQLRKALLSLTESQREVLILRFIDGLSVREIAQHLGKQQGAVRALKMRGLRGLAKSPHLHLEQMS